MTDLFWRDAGTGPPLVLLHGGFLDHEMWADQVPAFARTHRVITPDARGHGRSPNATAPFRPTDDLAALLRHLGTGPAVLAGVSMGAGIAVDTALEHPDLVRAVVVTGAGTSEPYFTDPWTLRTWGDWQAAMARGDLEAAIETFVRFAAGPHRALEEVAPDVLRRQYAMARRTMSKHTAGEPDVLLPVRDTWARAAAIEVPVLAVNGTLDSPDHNAMAERLTDTVRTGHATSIDATAHYPNMERPDAYNASLDAFLRTL